MKKKLLALSIGAALTAATVPAMSAELKISGRAHLSVDHIDNGASGDANKSGLTMSSNSSRLRVSGSKEVTEGLTAIMQLEQNVRFDQSGGSFASRDSFAGLKGDFGTVRLGFFDTPLKKVRSFTDMFGDRIGDARNITSGMEMGFDNRFRNGIGYTTPNFNGFNLDLQYSATNEADAGSNAQLDNGREAYSAALNFRADGLRVSLAVESLEQGFTSRTTANTVTFNDGDGIPVTLPTGSSTTTTSKKQNDAAVAYRLGLTYDFTKELKVAAFYQNSNKRDTYKADGTVNSTIGSRDVFGVGASYRMGDYVVRGQYYNASNQSGTKKTGADMYAVGLDRRFGRDLTLYGAYAMTNNQDNATFSAVGGGRDTRQSAVKGKDMSAFSVGLVYNF